MLIGSPVVQASTGTVQYAPDKSAFVWKIKQLGGGREFLMRAHFGLPSVRGGTIVFVLENINPSNIDLNRARKYGQTRSYHRQIRNSILHCLRYSSAVPQDRREEWIPGVTVGEIHHTER